jgi:hypothetical protein
VLVNEELASRSATDAARIAALRASAGGAARAGVARDCSVQQRPLGMAQVSYSRGRCTEFRP